jgi:hypothetical protein
MREQIRQWDVTVNTARRCKTCGGADDLMIHLGKQWLCRECYINIIESRLQDADKALRWFESCDCDTAVDYFTKYKDQI